MRYSGDVWQQLKNLTADDLISALEMDGWIADPCSGAYHPYVNPATRSRVIIHYHPRKTYGPGLLKGLLSDIGWSEEDMARLGLISGPRTARSEPVQRTVDIGDENPNGQLLAEEAEQMWVLLCKHCGNRYGAHVSEFHHRKCPRCQDGAAGLELPL